MFSLFCSSCSIEFDHSAVERLGRSEVVHNIVTMRIIQGPEHCQLAGGYVDGGEEVYPVDDLVTAWSGEGAVIGAVGGGGGSPAPPTGATPATRSEILKLELSMAILELASVIRASSVTSGLRAALSAGWKLELFVI